MHNTIEIVYHHREMGRMRAFCAVETDKGSWARLGIKFLSTRVPVAAGQNISLLACRSKASKAKYSETHFCLEKSRNGDTLGPVELNVWPEHPNQGERHEQDDQGDVSIIIFGMSKSSGFQKCSICWVFQALSLCLCLCRCLCHCLCLCICVLLLFLNSFHHKLSEYVWL